MTSPLGDDASTASFDTIENANIDLSKIAAVISWIDDNGETHFLSHDPSTHDHVTLDIHFHADHSTALFKIAASVAYKGKRNKSNVFLFLCPERIQNLAVVDNDEDAAARLGTSAYSLHFNLATPPSLVVPEGDWVPKNDAARSTLASLQSAAKKKTLHVTIPSRTLDVDHLTMLCEKASSSGCLKTPPNLTDVSRLYGGQGGMIVEYEEHQVDNALPAGEILRTAAEIAAQAADGDLEHAKSGRQQHPESPPSYDELGESPPAHPSNFRKRRRLDPDDDIKSANPERTSLEEICKRGFTEIGRRFDRIEQALGDLSSRLDRVEQLAMQNRPRRASSSEQGAEQGAAEQPQNLVARIDSVEERVTGVENKLETGLDELAQDVETQMYDVRQEFNDTITIRVDDEMGVAQSNLEDFVKDELRNAAEDVEEIVRERMRDALA